MARPRIILHADIDAFFASVEQLRNPHLRGRPVIVGSGVIASCSYEARRYGLRAGMSLAEARRRCPRVQILAGHAATYHCFAERVFEICRELAPAVDAYLDDAYLDLAGAERIYPNAAGAGRLLRAEVRARTGLAVTVGIGTNRMIARLASRAAKPDGLAEVPPGAEDDFLRGRPLLDLPGIGPRTAELLESIGLETVADLRAAGAPALIRLLGEPGRVLHERACGRDRRPVTPREIPRSISRETSFDAPATDPGAIDAMLAYLLERASRTARGLGLAARTVSVHVDPADGRREEARSTLSLPSALDSVLVGTARELLRRVHTRRVGLRRVGVTLSSLAPAAGEQLDLLTGARREREARLTSGVDRVRNRFGHGALVAGRSLVLLDQLPRDRYGFVLRTPSLTK
jgi:DNA polymerase-4